MRIYNKHNNYKRITNIIISLSIFILAFYLTLCMITWGGGASRLNNSAEALNSSGLSGAYKAGGGAELWSSYGFNPFVISDLKTKLFGTEDPVHYIRTNGAGDYNSYGKNSPNTAERGTPYYVVPATTINAKVGNATNGMVVKLGGKDWMVASLTIDNDGNVVMTLYLADYLNSYKFNSSNSNTKANGAYSRSDMRIHLKTNSNWQFYSSGDFASKYLVQPKKVLYQHTESLYSRTDPPWGASYNVFNDALGTLSSNWNSSGYTYKPSDTFTNANSETVRYDSWGDDYIWLPSVTETGYSDQFATASIWKLTKAQLSNSHSTGVYIRSAGRAAGNDAWMISSTGAHLDTKTPTTQYGVRPAIHLNFSAAESSIRTSLDDPQNVSTTYNGDFQTVKSVVDAKPTAYPWYDSKWYEHADNYINLTYQDSKGSTVASIKDAGEYWVKTEITQAWIDAVNDEVDKQGDEHGWSTEQKEEAKARRKPQFDGTADTSDSAHTESGTVRWFKFTVNKKEVTVNKPTYNASTGTLGAPSFADMTELYADVPVLGVRITGNASDGTTYDAIDTLPTKRGTYTARAVFIKSATDKTETETNYSIKDANDCKCDIVIGFNRLPIVGVANATAAYTGSEITFPLSGYSSAWATTADLTLPTGVTLKGSDSAGWTLAIEDAGEYTITSTLKSDKVADWCWDVTDKTQTPQTPQTFKITVTRKSITVNFTSTANNGAFSFAAGESVTLGAEANGAVTGDDVKISLSYVNKSNPTSVIDVLSGTLDASTLAIGSYTLTASIKDSAATDNKNYVLSGIVTQDFNVTAKEITLSGVNWQYSQNGGAVTAITGTGSSASVPFEVTYNGNPYVFSIDTTSLATSGVKIDASYGSSGYTNGMQTNAMTSAVAVTVRIVPMDGFSFKDASGNPLANQYKDYTLYVKINKAEIDFTGVKWSADELEFNAVSQSVSIMEGIPSFITVTYNSGASGREVGDYVARVSGINVVNTAVAANYNIPSVSSVAEFTHNWKIIKKKIDVSSTAWNNVEQKDGDTVIWMPSLKDNSLDAVTYTYWNADKTQQMTLSEIFADYTETQIKDYWVCAVLKPSGGSYNASNSELVGGDPDNGDNSEKCYYMFSVGSNKTPVRVSLKSSEAVYNGEDQEPGIEHEGGGLSDSDFTITYTKEDGTSVSAPRNAGKYKVHVTLNGTDGTHTITGARDFDYEIKKADYDLSGFKWVDTENENEEYVSAYVWRKDVSHTLSYFGTVDGLTIGYSAATEANLIGSDAGKYNVVVEFTVADPDNYNKPENLEFEWEIKAYTPDLSDVKWNYSTDSPFVFKIEDGVAKEYSVYLTGLPDGLEEIIKYTGHTDKYSNAGNYITEFSIDEGSAMRKNFGELVFSGGLETRLVWEVKPLTVQKPVRNQTQTFRSEGYTFAEITNLSEDWEQYFTVTVTDGEGTALAPTDGTWTFRNTDRYGIVINFKQGMNTSNSGRADNVKWTDNGRAGTRVDFVITKLVFEVKGWIDGVENARAQLDADDIEEIEKYFDYVLYNVDDNRSENIMATLLFDTVYTIALKLKEGEDLEQNVAVKYMGKEVEETEPYAFQTEADPTAPDPADYYRKPTEEELYIAYRPTGKEIEFQLGSWFVEEKMRIMSGVLKGTEEGIYMVRVGFKRGANAAWAPQASPADRAPVTVIFEISKDAKPADRFILTEEAEASHGYKFLYESFLEYEKNISEYVYSAGSVVYIAHLAFEDTLADLLRQFANAEDITAWGADGTLIEDLTTVLATGMMLRMMDGETVLNQLTISVMGDIDGDGDIGTADKARLNSYTLGNLELKGAYLLACDLDSDGEVGTADKARLNAYTLGNLDIYVGLILRVTAQATSEAVSACDEPAVAELAFSEESGINYVLSAATEITPLAQTSAIYAQATSSAFEYAVSASIDESETTEYVAFVDDCEIASDIAMAGNATLLLSNETTSAYTDITDIKNIVFATRVYADRKQRVKSIY